MAQKILLIDDEMTQIELVGSRLEANGYEVVFANNGKEGLEKAKMEKPDMILLDIIMPVMNGWETLEALKKDGKTRSIPVIMVTGKGDTSDLVKAMADGKAVDYVLKPCLAKDFLAKINRYLAPEQRVPEKVYDETMLQHIEQKLRKNLGPQCQ
jgi:CheY-like chemotaxis protein